MANELTPKQIAEKVKGINARLSAGVSISAARDALELVAELQRQLVQARKDALWEAAEIFDKTAIRIAVEFPYGAHEAGVVTGYENAAERLRWMANASPAEPPKGVVQAAVDEVAGWEDWQRTTNDPCGKPPTASGRRGER